MNTNTGTAEQFDRIVTVAALNADKKLQKKSFWEVFFLCLSDLHIYLMEAVGFYVFEEQQLM